MHVHHEHVGAQRDAVARAGGWLGWRRFTALVCGLYPLVVMTPVFVLVGHDLPASFVAIAGWGLCWAGLGVGLRRNG